MTMATKAAKMGDKRKLPSHEKTSVKNSAKKQKLDAPHKAPRFTTGHVEEISDDEEGGAKLPAQKKTGKNDGQKSEGRNGRTHVNGNDKSNANPSPTKTFERGESSRESHAKQKQLVQERKAAKPLADELARTKKLWGKLRLKSHVPKEERQTLVDELFSIITGRIKDFVLKHDSVRAVQTAIKYSTPEQRKQIAKELQGTYAQLAESRYAKFLIGKLLVQNDDEIRDIIVPEFYGKVRRLINHPEASWILDDIYRGVATAEQKTILLREWYGPDFALFRSGAVSTGDTLTADLGQILDAEPVKRAVIMKYLLDMSNGLVQKKMTGFTMLHDAMLQYFLNLKAGTEEQKEFLETVKGDDAGDLLKNMAFTKSGARLVCLLFAYGTAKDRKQLLKAYKDTFQLMCGDANGHVVILAAYDLIDDTVLTAKAILPEILGKNEEKDVHNIIFCANDLNARTTILYLFEGESKALFPASLSRDLEILQEIREIRKTTSKKDNETRRKELIGAASPQLLSAISASPNDLVSTSFGCQLVTDVLLSAVGDKAKALEAIAAAAEGSPEGAAAKDAYPPPKPHISQTPFGGKMLKTLIAGGRFDVQAGRVKQVDPPLCFANTLYASIREHILSWATGPSSFVPLALLEAEDFADKAELRAELSQNRAALEKAASEETQEQKAKREAAGTDAASGTDKKSKKGKKKAATQERAIGNAGARLLLAKL